MLVIFADRELLQILLNFADIRLTSKQKMVLDALRNHTLKGKPVTQLVKILARKLESSESALWLNLSQLRQLQLVKFGDAQAKGKPVSLTPIGNWLARNVRREVEK